MNGFDKSATAHKQLPVASSQDLAGFAHSRMKRSFDFGLSLFGIIATLPLMAALALCIRLTSGSPVLFHQERVGLNGKTFRIIKFRTMHHSGADAPKITVAGDTRITKVGGLLRKTKLDELPQLFNVFLGEMSFVGPRPEVADYVRHYSEQQAKVLSLRPGITDPASREYSNENDLLAGQENPHDYYLQHIMPDKIRLSLAYAENASLWSDVLIILQTLRCVVPLKGSGNSRSNGT